MSIILERIKEAYHFKTDAEVANFLDLKPSTLSMQKNRGRLNLQRIIRKCSDLNKNWLLDGHGKMKKEQMKAGTNRIPVYSSLTVENHAPDFYKSIKAGNMFADITEELREFASSGQVIGYVIPENFMVPILRKNDIAIINLDYSLSDNAICLISIHHQVSFRQIKEKGGNFILKNDDEIQDSPQVQTRKNDYNIIGRLVWIMRRVK